MTYHRSTLAEKQYVKGIVRNLSLLRWSDQEITDYLHNEKNMQISRPSITIIKNKIEKEAEKWYIELKQSRYKFLAMYKERLDSLLSYQKTLNDIVTTTKKEENKIRAIATLQSIELDIFNIYKQLPEIRIEDVGQDKDNGNKHNPLPEPTMEQVWGSEPSSSPSPSASASPISIDYDNRVITSTDIEQDKDKEDEYIWKP
jgi:hypothetical protein